MLALDTVVYVPSRKHVPEWRTTVGEVIATSTRQFTVQKQLGLSEGLTLADAVDRLTVNHLRTLANDRKLVVCG